MDDFVKKGKIAWETFKNMVERVEKYEKYSSRTPSYVNIDGCNPINITHYEIPGLEFVYNSREELSGAVCIKMMMEHCNCSIPLSQIMDWCSIASDEPMLHKLQTAVINASFHCSERFVLEPVYIEDYRELYHSYICQNVPVLVSLRTGGLGNYDDDKDHYAIISGFNSKYILLHDPHRGVIQVPNENFNRAVSSVKPPRFFFLDRV